MLKKIAITGSIATGKTTALKIFKKLGCYTLDADAITNHLLLNDKALIKNIIDLFGKEIIEKNQISKTKLAKIVFNDEKKLKTLEKLIHPKIFNEIDKEYEKVKNKNFMFFVVEIPLLFEVGKEKFFDIVITISSKEEIAKKRYKDEDYMLRKKRQMSLSKKEELSDFVIMNDKGLASLEENIKKVSKIINNI